MDMGWFLDGGRSVFSPTVDGLAPANNPAPGPVCDRLARIGHLSSFCTVLVLDFASPGPRILYFAAEKPETVRSFA